MKDINFLEESKEVHQITEYRKLYKKSILKPCIQMQRSSKVSNYFDFEKILAESSTFTLDRYLNSPCNLKRLIIENEHDALFYNEALIKTYPTKHVIKRFQQWFKDNIDKKFQSIKFSDIVEMHPNTKALSNVFDKKIIDAYDITQYNAEQDSESEIVTFYIPFFKNQLKQTNEIVKKLCDQIYVTGYNIASAEQLKFDEDSCLKPEIGIMYITFEPKFADSEFEFSEYLYHVTIADNLKKINQHGLVPKSQHSFFKYPDRVYLFNNAELFEILDYGLDKAAKNGKTRLALLRINSKQLTSDQKYKNGAMKFYADRKYPVSDSQHPIAIYTHNNVDRQFIDNEVMMFDVNGEKAVNKQKVSLSTFT